MLSLNAILLPGWCIFELKILLSLSKPEANTVSAMLNYIEFRTSTFD